MLEKSANRKLGVLGRYIDAYAFPRSYVGFLSGIEWVQESDDKPGLPTSA